MLRDEPAPVSVVLRKTLPTPKVLVAIPCFNEGSTIGSIVLKAREHSEEVVVVDDGSTDDTAKVAELAGAIVVRHQTNRGYGAALRSCLNYGRRGDADIMVVLDGDGQHDPAEIPQVLRPIIEGRADISVGSRFLRDEPNSVPRYRRIGIGVLTRLTNLGTRSGPKLRDAQSGFRAYSRRAIEVIDPRDSDMGASTEIIWDATRNGLRIEEVQIEVTYGDNASTKGPVQHGLSVIGSMIRYIETEHPLLLFGLPGVTLVLVGVALGNFVLTVYRSGLGFPIGWALLTVLVLILGMLLGFTGLILHAVINANRRSRCEDVRTGRALYYRGPINGQTD